MVKNDKLNQIGSDCNMLAKSEKGFVFTLTGH